MSLRVVIIGLMFTTAAAFGLIAYQISHRPRDAGLPAGRAGAGHPAADGGLPGGRAPRAGRHAHPRRGFHREDRALRRTSRRRRHRHARRHAPHCAARWCATTSMPGAPLLQADLMHPRDRGFLAAVLAPGTRAVSIGVNPVTRRRRADLAGRPCGRHSDPGTRPGHGGHAPPVITSETVLTDVPVIAVDQDIAQGTPPPATLRRPALRHGDDPGAFGPGRETCRGHAARASQPGRAVAGGPAPGRQRYRDLHDRRRCLAVAGAGERRRHGVACPGDPGRPARRSDVPMSHLVPRLQPFLVLATLAAQLAAGPSPPVRLPPVCAHGSARRRSACRRFARRQSACRRSARHRSGHGAAGGGARRRDAAEPVAPTGARAARSRSPCRPARGSCCRCPGRRARSCPPIPALPGCSLHRPPACS